MKWLGVAYGQRFARVLTNRGRSAIYSHAAQHSVHPTGGSLRVFKQFAWLKVGSVKMAFSRPTHQRVTQAVGHYTDFGVKYGLSKILTGGGTEKLDSLTQT
jgi:hypothetical protein